MDEHEVTEYGHSDKEKRKRWREMKPRGETESVHSIIRLLPLRLRLEG